MIKPPEKSIIYLMKNIINQPLTYTNFCKALKLPKKSTNSIPSQIKSIEIYCKVEIDTSKYPKTYKIVKVYDDDTPHFTTSISRDRYQEVFETILIYYFSRAKSNVLYLSNTELLLFFGVAYYNFKTACNKNIMKYLLNYKYMNEIALVSLKMLKAWVMLKINKMESNGVIKKRVGYRGYKKENNKYEKIDIPIDSESEKICDRIYNETYTELSLGKWKNGWIPNNMSNKFEAILSSRTKKEFNGKYDTIKKVIVLQFSKDRRINRIDGRSVRKLKNEVNKEARRKIKERKELRKFEDEKIEEFIKINFMNSKIDLMEEYNKVIELVGEKRDKFIQSLCEQLGISREDVEELYKKEIEKMVKDSLKNYN